LIKAAKMILLPEVTEETRAFWTGGLKGELLIMACDACNHRIHPPQLVCPKCLSNNVTPIQSSGRGRIYSYTVNHQKWSPDMETPYVIAVIDLDDQPGVRLTATIRGCPVDDVFIGAAVMADFQKFDEVAVPFFRLSNDAST
ncbi:MAG: OB-fold domain-containing protein, partial [Pseudomonadota bacterium]